MHQYEFFSLILIKVSGPGLGFFLLVVFWLVFFNIPSCSLRSICFEQNSASDSVFKGIETLKCF